MDKSIYTFRHVAFEISQNKDITLFNKVNEYNFSYEELENKNIDKDLLDKGEKYERERHILASITKLNDATGTCRRYFREILKIFFLDSFEDELKTGNGYEFNETIKNFWVATICEYTSDDVWKNGLRKMKKPEYGSFLEMFKSSKVNEKEFIETIERFIKGIISWYRYVCKDDAKANERKDFLYSATQLNLMKALYEIKNELYSGFPMYPFFNEELAEYTWLGVATEDYSSFMEIYLEEFVRSFSRELKDSIILLKKKWILCLFERILEYMNVCCHMQEDVEAREFIDKIFEKTAQCLVDLTIADEKQNDHKKKKSKSQLESEALHMAIKELNKDTYAPKSFKKLICDSGTKDKFNKIMSMSEEEVVKKLNTLGEAFIWPEAQLIALNLEKEQGI